MRTSLKSILLVFFVALPYFIFSQGRVGIGTLSPDLSALLDVNSTDKGILIPRLTTGERTGISAPANGLLVFDSNTKSFWYFDSTTSSWLELRAGNIRSLVDNDNDTKVQVEKNTDEDIIRFDLAGTEKMILRQNANGQERLEFINSNNSLAIGTNALALDNNNSFSYGNTAIGAETLWFNTDGGFNTAVGTQALRFNTNGTFNTAIGVHALGSNNEGFQNSAFGVEALTENTTGYNNTALGMQTLYLNKANRRSTAVGYQAMYYSDNRTTGRETFNTAVGNEALKGSSTASANTGQFNTAIGDRALFNNTSGNNNVALGRSAGLSGNHNNCTFLGTNISIGTGSNRTNVSAVGFGIADAQCTGDNQILLGNTGISEIRAQVTGITAYSDSRFKTNIFENVKGLDFINKLRPVTYHQNAETLHRIWGTPDSLIALIDHSDSKKKKFIGFLAQEVEQAALDCGFDFPGLDIPNNEKEVYSLRYTDFIMPLVKAIQEQQIIIENLKTENKKLSSKMDMFEEKINLIMALKSVTE